MRTTDDIQDELLVLRCQDGDEAALGELVSRWHSRLLRHAVRLVEQLDGANDVMQEAWVAIIRGIDRLDDAACFRRWAYRITSNKAADWIRRRQRGRDEAEPLPDEPADGGAGAPQDEISELRDAVKKLPGPQRAVLAMFYLENLSVAEIAASLTIPAGTVKSRLHHAREKLKEILERTTT